MPIEEVFTRLNLEILRLLEQKPAHVREIAEHLRCSPAKVVSCIEVFKKHKLITEEKHKNKKVIKLNKRSSLLKHIQSLLATSRYETHDSFPDQLNLFEAVSPLDFRYYGRNPQTLEALKPYLSESGFVRYACKVEAALTKTLAKLKICSPAVSREVSRACRQVTAEEVYAEEDRIKHNIRALANSIRMRVTEKAKPFVHFTTTSHDIICTSDAARYKDCTSHVLVPALIELEKTLIKLSLQERATLQIGRTHGQHAEPITFGFALAQYVSRLGHSIQKVAYTGDNLRGKIAGAVGSYNASSLFFKDPEKFERLVLKEVGLKPSPISTQVVEAEYLVDYGHALISCFGVLANLADDMRHLQRSEIGEVGEHFEAQQVGSSTMPQKRNPINFENVKSMYKAFSPRIMTMYGDQLSEHQRDLTNSASMRFVPELITALYVSVKRMNRVMGKLVVDETNMQRNFDMHKDLIAAEPVYILLAAQGHPDAHEYVRKKTLEAQHTGKSFSQLIMKDKALRPYLEHFSPRQKQMIKNPELYTGIAAKKTVTICTHWKKRLKVKV